MTDDPCQPCQEQEHDVCHNLLWDAGCPCPHDAWPELLCQVRGRDKGTRPAQYFCDLPRHHRGTHQGRHWVLPNPDENTTARWWGWRPRPIRWTNKIAIAPPGRFDPYDPTVPSPADRVVV